MKYETGLRTTLYTFALTQRAKYEAAKVRAAKRGTVTECFINNGYAFELVRFKVNATK